MNEQQHILSAFDRDLEAIQAHIMKIPRHRRAADQRPAQEEWQHELQACLHPLQD